jgi:GR25 family glycosyltransferase involved in LPS biosynthesis
MQCILINLDDQPERRQKVEANFAETCTSNWTMGRMSAINAQQVDTSEVKGRLTAPEKGCFLSHLIAINASRQLVGHTMIVEDDVLFGEQSFVAIDKALELASGCEWDIIFTDVCVPDIRTMVEMYTLRKQLAKENQLRLIGLDGIVFGGSAAYIINAQSKDKLLALLTEKQALDLPYDLALRRLVFDKRLQGFVVFPFPTSLSAFADASQIQHEDTTKIADVAWNAFRRLVWIGGSACVAAADLDAIPESFFDPECRAFAKILSCMLSSNFEAK